MQYSFFVFQIHLAVSILIESSTGFLTVLEFGFYSILDNIFVLVTVVFLERFV